MEPRIVHGGNILESTMQTLVNPVNCVGVMGAGLALQFKKRFPKNFEHYLFACRVGDLGYGVSYLYRPDSGSWILNFPTKEHWRNKSKVDMIVKGLDHLLKCYRAWGITSIAFPLLGCGLGGLQEDIVKPLLLSYCDKMDALEKVEIYT